MHLYGASYSKDQFQLRASHLGIGIAESFSVCHPLGDVMTATGAEVDRASTRIRMRLETPENFGKAVLANILDGAPTSADILTPDVSLGIQAFRGSVSTRETTITTASCGGLKPFIVASLPRHYLPFLS